MKPLLASSISNFSSIVYPVGVFIKLDGIRCLITENGPVTRKLKPIPNKYIHEQLVKLPIGYDGELTLTNNSNFNEVQSAVMSKQGEPDFIYWVFDKFTDPESPFVDRHKSIEDENSDMSIRRLEYTLCYNEQEIQIIYNLALRSGHEGIIIRSLEGQYKYGRSSIKEGYMLKRKPVLDTEATVVGFLERQHNINTLKKNKLGYTERSSKKEGMQLAGTLGALVMEKNNSQFTLGVGFTDIQRKNIWDDQQKFLGKKVTFTYQSWSVKNKPRFPIFKHFRCDDE